MRQNNCTFLTLEIGFYLHHTSGQYWWDYYFISSSDEFQRKFSEPCLVHHFHIVFYVLSQMKQKSQILDIIAGSNYEKHQNDFSLKGYYKKEVLRMCHKISLNNKQKNVNLILSDHEWSTAFCQKTTWNSTTKTTPICNCLF